jgi:hypothetical protein
MYNMIPYKTFGDDPIFTCRSCGELAVVKSHGIAPMLCGTSRYDDGKVLLTDKHMSKVWAKYHGNTVAMSMIDGLVIHVGNCYSCDRVIYDDTCKLTYVVPERLGGENIPENLRPTCGRCYVLCDEQNLNDYIGKIVRAKPQKSQYEKYIYVMLNSHLDAKLGDIIDGRAAYIATVNRIVTNPAYYEQWEASLELAKLDATPKCVFSVSLGTMQPRMTVGRAPIKLGDYPAL